MHPDYIHYVLTALVEAEKEANTASYLAECGCNAGIRAINSKKASVLADLIYCTKQYLKSLGVDPDGR